MANQHTKAKDAIDDFLDEARARFELADEAERDQRELWIDDMKFLSGEQWPEELKRQRAADNRPCLTINRLPQFVRQITNEQRQNRPSIKVSPVDDGADVETAEIYQGLIRHIEYDSNADVAYDTGFYHAVGGSFGYLRVITEYSDPFSFNQDIKIKRVRNPLSVYIDPDAREADRSDMKWAFIVEDLSEEEFKTAFPKAKINKDRSGWELGHDKAPKWLNGKGVRVAEYFHRTTKAATLCRLNTGDIVLKANLPTPLPEGMEILEERETQLPTIKWCKINGVEILEETEWPGQWIPVVPILGDEMEIEGKVILTGIVRDAKDSMRMLNFWATAETEAIALAPRAPYVGAEGQFEGRETEWKTANTKNHAFLQYKPVAAGGQALPPPQRQFGEPAVMAITNAKMQAQEDLKAVTGIYDASLGARSNETSGRAINARKQQGELSNYHLIDNLTRAIRHVGRILIDLIPRIYDASRVIRVIGEDGEQKTVRINEEFKDEKTGDTKRIDLGVGKYDVTVSVGPSYASRRQEAVQSMIELSNGAPELKAVMADLMVRSMDWPGATKIADRLKKMLPPQLADEEEGKAQVPPPVMAQMQQMQQQLQMAGQAMQQGQAQMQQLAQENEALKQQANAKAGDQALKVQELQIKAQAEGQKIQNERIKLDLEAQRIQIEKGRLILDSKTAGPEKEMAEDPETGELVHQAPPVSREDLALIMQAQSAAFLQGLEMLASQPVPPQTVVLQRTPEGGLVGQIQER